MIAKYDKSQPRIGVTGKTHDSEAEAKISFFLYQHGWVPCTKIFPIPFTDSNGTIFHACPDFFHSATGFYAEFKAHKLNGKKTKSIADAAMKKVDAAIAIGHLAEKKRPYRALKNAWNHSIQSMACKSAQLPSNMPLILIYESEQDLNEERRCQRNGVFMLTTKNISGLHLFLKMASLGLSVGFTRNGFRYSAISA